MPSQKVRNGRFLSFRRKPESSSFVELQIIWTPVFTGVTTSYEAVKLEVFGWSGGCEILELLHSKGYVVEQF